MVRFVYSRQDVDRLGSLIGLAKAGGYKNVFMIVPEQLSMQREFSVSMQLKNVRVCSFSRLTNEIFRTLGGAASKTPGGAAVTAAITLAVQNTAGHLRYYKSVCRRPGFIKKLAAVFEQFDDNRITYASLGALPERELTPSLVAKYGDLFAIYDEYKSIWQGGSISQGDSLEKAAGLLELSDLFDGALVIFDGFYGFTPAQHTLIEQVLQKASDTVFSFTTDLSSTVFETVTRELEKLGSLCKKHGITPYYERANGTPYHNTESQRRLERCLFDADSFSGEPLKNTDTFTVYAAKNLTDELSFIACKIKNDVLSGKYRYKDIAILAPSFENISTIAQAVFEKHSLPVFVDARHTLLTKPHTALSLYALDIAINGFDSEAVLSLVKTGLAGIALDDIGLVERYVKLWKLKGSDWTDGEWTRSPSGVGNKNEDRDSALLKRLNELKHRITAPLVSFKAELSKADTCRDMLCAVYSLFESFDTERALFEISDRFEKAGDPESADEFLRSYDTFISMLESIDSVMGDKKLSARRFSELISSCAESVNVTRRPARIDEVTFAPIGSVRADFARCVYVPCLTNDVYPSVPPDNSLITEKEKRLFMSYGIAVPMDSVSYALRESFNLYTAALCATDELCLSYSQFEMTGQKLCKSSIITDALKVTGINETERSDLPAEFFLGDIAAATELAGTGACPSLQKIVYDITGIEPIPEKSADAPLEMSIVEGMYSKDLRLSFSGIDNFVQCPFSFFLGRGLRLDECEPVEFDPANAGTFIHKGLERLLGDGYDILSSTDESVIDIARDITKDYYETVFSDCKGRSARFDYLFAKAGKAFESAAVNIAREIRESKFEPFDFEISISDYIPKMSLGGGFTLSLGGSIDRVDICNDQARVIDYKSGKQTFSLEGIYNGISMQLPIYSAAVRSKYPDLKIAAMYYIKVGLPKVELKDKSGISEEDYQKLVDSGYKRDGVFAGDAIESMNVSVSENSKKQSARLSGSLDELIDFTLDNVRGIGSRIAAGDISISPITCSKLKACEYCRYGDICRISQTPEKQRGLETPPKDWLKGE